MIQNETFSVVSVAGVEKSFAPRAKVRATVHRMSTGRVSIVLPVADKAATHAPHGKTTTSAYRLVSHRKRNTIECPQSSYRLAQFRTAGIAPSWPSARTVCFSFGD